MTAPAIKGPTEAMNSKLATTIIHTASGTSKAFIPGARAFIAVTMKLMPPSRKATNSNATASTHMLLPIGVRLYLGTAESGGGAGPPPPPPPPRPDHAALRLHPPTPTHAHVSA